MHERACVARHLASRTGGRAAERAAVDGAQHGLAVTVMALPQLGDVVAVDALTYPGFQGARRGTPAGTGAHTGIRTGADLDALERLCARRRVKAIYAMPTLHNPLGRVMTAPAPPAGRHRNGTACSSSKTRPTPFWPMTRRRRWQRWHRRRRCTSRVFLRSVATGLRMGFVAAPDVLVPSLEGANPGHDLVHAGRDHGLACAWLEDGTFRQPPRGGETAGRGGAGKLSPARSLPDCCRRAAPSSYFVWLSMPDETPRRLGCGGADAR